jgi:hypothetical protein
MDRHVYSNDVSTCQNISITCQCTNHRQRNGGGIPYGGMGTGHGYEPVYITPHDVCNQPPVTLQMSNKSPILKRYCKDHVPSAAEFAYQVDDRHLALDLVRCGLRPCGV